MSGVVLTGEPMPVAAPTDAFAGIIPIVPTTRREFEKGDRARAFVRIYQRERASVVQVNARITDAADRIAVDKPDTLSESRFASHNAADYTYELPIASLSPGNYLLSIEAKLDKKTSVRRDVRFALR
jgi:hypothetical protein